LHSTFYLLPRLDIQGTNIIEASKSFKDLNYTRRITVGVAERGPALRDTIYKQYSKNEFETQRCSKEQHTGVKVYTVPSLVIGNRGTERIAKIQHAGVSARAVGSSEHKGFRFGIGIACHNEHDNGG
jgi:hypothetical protein